MRGELLQSKTQNNVKARGMQKRRNITTKGCKITTTSLKKTMSKKVKMAERETKHPRSKTTEWENGYKTQNLQSIFTLLCPMCDNQPMAVVWMQLYIAVIVYLLTPHL